MTWGVAVAVLFGALLHAGWNTLVKASTDKALDTALIHLIGSLLAVPVVAMAGLPPAASWPFLACSVTIHVGYYMALAGAYRHGDLGLTYPLMRGAAPLLVALASMPLLGEPLSPVAWAGVLAVCGGVLLLGLSPAALQSPRAVAFALANAVVIAVYTVVDGLGARASVAAGGHVLQYVALLSALDGWAFAWLVLRRRGHVAAWDYARRRAPLATVGAMASLGSYGIALWAMTLAPVALVAALRETSVLFAVLLGWWLLHEAATARRLLGLLAIVAGVAALRLG